MGEFVLDGHTVYVDVEVVYLVAFLVLCAVVILSSVIRNRTGGGGWDK